MGVCVQPRRLLRLLLLLLLLLFAAGCASGAEAEAGSIEFRKDRSLTVHTVEPFDQKWYSESELKKQIQDAVRSYDAAGKRVSVRKFDVHGKKAYLTMYYASSQDFMDFNDGNLLYYGTVDGALEDGFDLRPLYGEPSQKDTNQILSASRLTSLGDRTVIYLTEPVSVTYEGSVLFRTRNISPDGKGGAQAAETVSVQEPAIMILQ